MNNDWQSFLAGGLSALIDSQSGSPYSAVDPRYNTATGVAGQSQTQAITSNPLVVGALVVVVGLVVFALVRR